MPKKIKVLSLFDGISCAQVALKSLGYEVEYYASEIDKYAVGITQRNHPDTVQLGDVCGISYKDGELFSNYGETPHFKYRGYDGIDLLIGGSPCQDLSIARKSREGLAGKKSGLFYEYLRILKEVKPKYFILENVASMRNEARDEITKELGVEPIMIDAGLVSAQTRKRYFWTNIPGITQPEERGLVIKDIWLPVNEVEKKYWYEHPINFLGNDKAVCAIMEFNNQEMHKRIFNPLFKCATLTTCGGGGVQKKVLQDGKPRKLTPLEYERLQCLPDNYTAGVSDGNRYNTIGNAFNVEVIKHIIKQAIWN